ncbi:MAG: V-type ATP synthase subunit E [Promethearchaeota archaeon]
MTKAKSAEGSATSLRRVIIRDARTKADKITKEAEAEARVLEKEAQQRAKTQLAGWADRQREAAQRAGAQIIGQAQRQAQMQILDTKSKLISSAVDKARQRIEKERGQTQYKTLLKELIISAGVQIGGDLVVLARKEDHTTLSGLTGVESAISKETGEKIKVSVGKQALECAGGIVVQNAEGSIIVDYRLETLLGEVERTQRTAIAKVLFGE